MTADDARIVRLEARVAALESALRRRSEELREILAGACAADRARIHTVLAREIPTASGDAGLGRETYWTAPAEVIETLTELWTAVAPRKGG